MMIAVVLFAWLLLGMLAYAAHIRIRMTRLHEAKVRALMALVPQERTPRYVIAWWNGCTMELSPGIHAANAVVYCCSVQPRARA